MSVSECVCVSVCVFQWAWVAVNGQFNFDIADDQIEKRTETGHFSSIFFPNKMDLSMAT